VYNMFRSTILLLIVYSVSGSSLVVAVITTNKYMIYNDIPGELVQEGRPTCLNRTVVYRCTVREGDNMIWRFTGRPIRAEGLFDFNRFYDFEGEEHNALVANVPVLFRVTNITPSFISVTVTIPGPVPLNGVQMDCNGDVLEIIAPSEG